MLTCANCGAENREGARFCDVCGRSVALAEAAEPFRKTVTVLFSDVVGSTSLGEQLDPEALSQIMTEYFDAMRPIVERHGGTLAKFVAGDTANVAARLQQLAEGGEILLGEGTYRLIRHAADAALLPPVEVKGKAAPL